MNAQNNQNPVSVEGKADLKNLKLRKSSFWKFMIAFAAIILLVLGGYWLWE